VLGDERGPDEVVYSLHPFRDGNGRLARWLADLMALQAGLPAPDYGFTGRGGKVRQREYLIAVGAGYVQDYEALTRFFLEAIERRLRAARR
jgi:cell filamentation protein